MSLDSQTPHPVIQVPSQQIPKKTGIQTLHDCDAEIERQTHTISYDSLTHNCVPPEPHWKLSRV